MKRMRIVFGDDLIMYCFGSVSCEDTLERLTRVIPYVGNEEIRAHMFVLREKIDQCMDDEDWALYFPKLLRNMAVYLGREKENFETCVKEMHKELKRLDQEGRLGPKYGYSDDDEE